MRRQQEKETSLKQRHQQATGTKRQHSKIPGMQRPRIVAFLALLIGLGIIFTVSPQLLEAKEVFDEGNSAYTTLRDQVVKDTTADTSADPGALASGRSIDFEALQAINSDVVAWLYNPGTMIDYPVVKASEYNYYLYHLLDHSYNTYGTLFIDYNNAPDFSESLTVIYGHHVATEMMFSSLMGYKNQAFYQEHAHMYLYTEDAEYRVDLLYGCVISVGEWRARAFMFSENLDELLAYAAMHSTFASNISYRPGDRVVAMSTCSFEFNDARYVVLGVLREV